MEPLSVMIVEDDFLLAMDVETALVDAGHIVCAIAATQTEAISIAAQLRPDCAVVDVSLSPGDGRAVATALVEQGVAVLFATGQCEDAAGLALTGALGCLPKPYEPTDIPAALDAICRRRGGKTTAKLPHNMFMLHAA